MAERLIRILAFVNVADGASVALPHGINVAGTPMVPDLLAMDGGGFSATADEIDVTVTNTSGGIATVNVWAQLVHSVPREIGAIPLAPSPFVIASGGSAGVTTTFTFDELGETQITVQDQILLTDARTVALGRKLIIQATLWSDWTNTGGGTPMARQMLRILRDPGGKGQQTLGNAASHLEGVNPEVGVRFIGQSIAAAAEYIGDGTPQTFGLDFDGSPIPNPGVEDYVARRTTWLLIETNV